MWGDPDPDPGGPRSNVTAPSPQELSDLKDQNEQQTVLIAQLKEMLRKEQSSVSQEKVEEYVNTLNRNKAKRSFRQKKDGSNASKSGAGSSVGIDASKKERINLLRQQMEENKARLAERGKSQRGIEEMVTQLQAQLKDNQTLISSTPHNVSLVESKNLDYTENTPQKDLYNILLTKEKKISELLNKSQKLEGTILDLQENIKEKDSVIDARTKAITLMTDSLSKKGKSTLDALDETKEQMRKMQENFVTFEAEMKARQLTLLNDLKMKNFEINDLQQVNSQLENEKSELEKRLSETQRSEISARSSENLELEQLGRDLETLQIENENYIQKIKVMEERSVNNIADSNLQNKFEESCQQNAEYLSRISQLELQLEEAMSKLKTHEQTVLDSSNDLKEGLEKENSRLLEENEKLSRDNLQHLSRISELEKHLEEALGDLNLLKSTGMDGGAKTSLEESEEITKLKKQLEESNKNMIKMRAVQKGKIKELNKKLDQFRKMSDSNALVSQLQNEVSKLNEKIAELEDEKGNLQLKMVESTSSSKDDSSELEERLKELEDKLSTTTQELEEKDRVIELLESEILSLKAALQQKSEEEVRVSSQVSSEISSINYEEQIERIESEKKKLVEELAAMQVEKEDLLKELEHVKKEKQDMVTKLDNYIQENMDLIDKLEKLSAEKVSSAESIEIVEGLTQQEKLELAAYQKHINPEEPLKCSDDDNLDQPAELNESVLQLGEDTVELLQKIEMFTQERKEVMQKMEALKEENNLLNLKLKEIENNRDILEETYEQLQNEKEILVNEKQDLMEKLGNIDVSDKENDESAEVLNTKLNELQIKCEALIQENDELKRTLKEFDSKMQEKYDLETRLQEMVDKNSTLESKLLTNIDDINKYTETIAKNKNKLTHSDEIIDQMHSKLEEREKDIEELHTNINDLNLVISELQNKNQNYELMEQELQNLKLTLNEQISQANDYESEMVQSNENMQQLKTELVQMNRRIIELENELELKNNEIHKVVKDISNKDEIINNLQSEIKEKDQKFKTVSEEIKEKYLQLQKQLDGNGESLKKQIDELTGKNKEQLEKMKKIAANLKKKTVSYQQLEDQYKSDREKWENETNEKNNTIQESQNKVGALNKELDDIKNKLKANWEEKELIQNELIALRQNFEILEQTNADQQNFIQDLKHKQEKLHEVSLQQEMSDSLHEEIDSSFPRNIPEEKVRELELLLETNESELNHYRERINKFEDMIRKLEEEKSVLENKNDELVEKLDLTSNSFKEKALLEDQLELRLAEVSANDETLSKKLQETQKEQEELHKKNHEYEELIKKLKIKLKKAHDKVTELKSIQTNLQELEIANQELKKQVTTLEANQRHIQSENESLQRRNMSDYEKIEADYQIQLEELLKAKNDLTVENEKLLEKLKELDEKEQDLIVELDEYKLRLEQSENSHIEEINRLNEDLKVAREELEATRSESQKSSAELKETRERLQGALTEVDGLKCELNSMEQLKEQLASSSAENQQLDDQLQNANSKLEHMLVELDSFKQQLNNSNEKLQVYLQENNSLKNEIDKLKHVMGELELAKSNMEASFEAAQKVENIKSEDPVNPIVFEEFSQQNAQQQQRAIPTFQWPDQPQQTSTDQLFDAFSKPQGLLGTLEPSNQLNITSLEIAEVENRQLDASNEMLQSVLEENGQLRAESDILKQEIQALQFAKSSLEASYESSQKLDDKTTLGAGQTIVLEEFPQKIQKQSRVVPPALFDSFVQPSNESPFDIFSAPPSGQNQWLNQPKTNQQQQPISLPKSTDKSNDFNAQTQACPPVIENDREALLKKIKALEFLLYNVDKEKEIGLKQCTEMVNELTQIIYDQVNAPQQNKSPVFDLESQIMSQEDIDSLTSNKEALQQAEYAPTHRDSGESSIPVNEDIIEPTKAYQCFTNADPSKKQDKTSADVEAQIVSDQYISELASNIKELQKLEFERVKRSLGEQQQPVVEPLAQPKHAYLTYTKEDKPQSFEAFEENDDGWGWGPEEARLEEEHMSSVENTPQVKTLLLEIQQLKENLRVLQVERENHLEEIKQLQIKSGKLIKKCKELKAKSEQASTSKKLDDGGFFDLNETIQEELKAQVQQLEKKVKEISTEMEKEKLEKTSLLKKVDVLTSANERMVEMKEIQDSEVLRWKRNHQEAVNKLQEYEWTSDGFGEGNKKNIDEPQPSTSVSNDEKIQELENTIRDLTLDNEELQTLLEEQNARRLEAEKNKNTGNDQEISDLRSLNATLHREVDEIKLRSAELHTEIGSLKQDKDTLICEKSDLEVKIQMLEENLRTVGEHQNAYDDLQNRDQISNLETLREKDSIIQDLRNNLEQLIEKKVELEQTVSELSNQLEEKGLEIENLQSYLEKNDRIMSLEAHVERLNSSINTKEQAINDLNLLIENLKAEKKVLNDVLTQTREKSDASDEALDVIKTEKEKRDSEYQQVLEVLQMKTAEVFEFQRMIQGLQEHVKELEVYSMEKTKKLLENKTLEEELRIKAEIIEEKQRLLEELQLKASESDQLRADKQQLSKDLDIKIKEVEVLTEEKLEKDAEIEQLSADLQSKEEEFQERTNDLVNELNNNWQVQVDQRGADIADSWKMHLDMVEKDYNTIQEKLKAKVVELEEKCNILVNENNELRKNVDQEIRNEVDKLSALQQQISTQHQTINTLNLAIQEKDKQIEEIQNNLVNYQSLENELQALRRDNSEKESKLSSINVIIETTQKQFDEKREVVDAIVSILETNASSPVSYEKEDILKEFQKQLGLVVEKDNEIRRLNQCITEIEGNLAKLSGENRREITGLNQVIEDLEKDLSVVHEKEAEIVRLTTELTNIQLEKGNLQQEMNNTKQEKGNILPEFEKLKQEYANCLVIVEDYKQKVQEYSHAQIALQQALDEKNKTIDELNEKLRQLSDKANDNNKEMETLNATLSKAKDDYKALQDILTACQNELYEATQQLAQKSQELEAANQNLPYYQQNCMAYEEEVRRLKETLDQREREFNNSLEILKNNQLADIQRHYDELLTNRDLDHQTLQAQAQELLRHNGECNERLNQELTLKQELEQKLNEKTQLIDEDTRQLEELKLIIEDQVARIEELKKELFDKSNQYDSLIAEMDVGRQPVTQQPIASTSVNPLEAVQKPKYTNDDDLTEPVSRAELDLALYMLHQRDVRCEELTVELTQLLEERDTLQLRLSNALREKEDLRRSVADHYSVPEASSDKENASPRSKSSAIFLAASGTELAKEPLENDQSLASKLSELKIVGYKRDKTFVDEQDARRLQQLAIMQEHINEASKLPPEAAARLVDASYTLSRDVQSPSKVLLNWLWGKNPPKANDS